MAILDYEGLLIASGEWERLWQYKAQADKGDVSAKIVVELAALLVGITAAGCLPIVAAAGAKLIAGHIVGLTIDRLISVARDLKAGKAPKEIAKDMTKDLGIALGEASLEDGITQCLEAVKDAIPNIVKGI
jgi:hypothetical protein